MRTTSSSNRFKVYEFNEGDEQIEKESAKLFKKFGNPKSDDSALTKYDFLQCFARELKTGQKDSSNEPLVMETCNGAFKKWTSDNGPFRINPSNDDCIELSSSSTSVSDTAENEDPSDEQVLEDGFGGNNIDTVLVSPDHILYGDLNCTECLLSFSCCGIKLEGSTLCGIKEHFSFEWAIDDLIKIESHWCGQVETDNVNLHLKSKDAKVAENSDGTSGTAVLNFAVPHWSNIQEEINSLNMRYKAIWNVIFDIDTTRSEDVCLEPRSIFSRKHHLSNFGESFEEVIYPKGDPDAVSICKRDIELLQPATFINDTIIDFYIQYLKNKIKPEEKHRFHFFSSFFFRKLADPEDPSRACEVREAFQRVCKWTRKVNLFQKDYIFIPVNFSLHWSLIVICHPGEVADFEGEEIGKSSKVPCILHMDSMKGSHRGLKNLIQSYLWEEWKERQRESVEDVSLKFLNLQFVSLELPQQENCFDCGLFLLHYVELFLEQAPVDFRLFSNKKFSHFLSKDWFPPAEVSMKRDHIRKLIYEIVEDNSLRVPQAACNDDYPSMLQDVNGRDTGVEFLGEISNSAEKSHGSLEITPLSASPLRGLQCFRESRLVFEDLLNPGATAGLLTDGSFQPFGQIVSHSRFKTVISPIEEGEETVERFSYSPTEAAGRHADETTVPSTSYSAKTVEALQISMHLEEDEEEPVSSEVGVSEIHRYEELLGSSPQEEIILNRLPC
ncbi:probable ubiquitin-like-specific protease 2B isoform X2 [Cornus florida]|uniref:probable ubiquitin-like-specific protease 2B isoform X2 n=1 Tax=Cornus florida TaxID=4283 RepID=UPI00289BC01F|nr:probable ubiquitin-like-specific protease 2B isoform X2 [Cornus florida]